jgi:hypothetical protein
VSIVQGAQKLSALKALCHPPHMCTQGRGRRSQAQTSGPEASTGHPQDDGEVLPGCHGASDLKLPPTLLQPFVLDTTCATALDCLVSCNGWPVSMASINPPSYCVCLYHSPAIRTQAARRQGCLLLATDILTTVCFPPSLPPATHARTHAHTQLPADKDVAKRVFYLQEGRIRLDFHLGPGRITASSHAFHKDGQSQIVQVRTYMQAGGEGVYCPLAAKPSCHWGWDGWMFHTGVDSPLLLVPETTPVCHFLPLLDVQSFFQNLTCSLQWWTLRPYSPLTPSLPRLRRADRPAG